MTDRIPQYEDFCQEVECIYHDFLARVESKPPETLSEAEKRQLNFVGRICREHCDKTEYQFYRWLKETD